MRSGKLFDAEEIRVATDVTSTLLHIGNEDIFLFFAVNGLNTPVDLQYQGSFDGATWFDLGGPVTVSASGGTDAQTLSDPWPQIQIIATAAGASGATTGSLTVNYAGKRSGGL